MLSLPLTLVYDHNNLSMLSGIPHRYAALSNFIVFIGIAHVPFAPISAAATMAAALPNIP